jgi:hypothetical protein
MGEPVSILAMGFDKVGDGFDVLLKQLQDLW